MTVFIDNRNNNSSYRTGRNIQIIWTITQYCPFQCSQCVVNANNTQNQRLSDKELINIAIKLKKIEGVNFDLSGGDNLFRDEDFKIVKKIVKILGTDKCSISTTGLNLDIKRLNLLSTLKNGVDFTIDESPGLSLNVRPHNYTKSAIKGIKLCSNKDIPISVFTVLNNKTSTFEISKI